MNIFFTNIKAFSYILLIFSLNFVAISSSAQTDTLRLGAEEFNKAQKNPQDTLPDSKGNELKTTAKFRARDSIVIQVKKKKAALYEKAKINYGETQLTAARIFMDMEANIVRARPKFDSLNKKKLIDKPVLKEKIEEFAMDSVDYNLNSQKGLIFNIVTKQGEGFIGGERVKKDAENELYIRNGHYTTCNLAHPHFRIVAKKIKITKNQNVIVGPFYMEVGDVPTPLGFAFGVFPKPQQKTSGLIIPEYGEARETGFFLRGGGYYWAISEQMDARFTSEIYTYGNWGAGSLVNYKRLYKFNGNFNITYRSLYNEPLNELNRARTGQFNLTWSHVPETKGTGKFSASVNIASQGFNRTSVNNISQTITTNLTSTANYSKSFKDKPFALNVSARHNQDLNTNVVTLNLPAFNFTVNQIFPFKSLVKKSTSFFSTIGINYSLNGSNDISNNISRTSYAFETTTRRKDSIYAFKPENFALFFRNAKVSLSHTSTLSAPFKILKKFNGSVGANASQAFHQRTFRYTWIPNDTLLTAGAVRVDTLNQWGTSYRYSLNSSISTNVYGFYNFPKSRGRLQAIRHTIIPNMSFSYSPDFSTAQYGFYQQGVQTKANTLGGRAKFEDLARFENVQAAGRQGNISINVRNIIEAKLRSRLDSAGAKPQKINILDELSFTTAYNIFADTLKTQYAWANVGFTARTNLFKMIDVNFTGSLDPYVYKDTGIVARKIKTFDLAWRQGRLGQVSSISVGFSTTLSPEVFKKGKAAAKPTPNTNDVNKMLNPFTTTQGLTTSTVQNPLQTANQYVDFDLPWSLNINYTLSIIRIPISTISQAVVVSGNTSLTPKWKINFNTSYDLQKNVFASSQFSFIRDLHCWQMSFDWQPFGPNPVYSFRFAANASTLKDLKIERRRTLYDR